MSGASKRANGRASGPVLTSLFLFVPNHSALSVKSFCSPLFDSVFLMILPPLSLDLPDSEESEHSREFEADSRLQLVRLVTVEGDIVCLRSDFLPCVLCSLCD